MSQTYKIILAISELINIAWQVASWWLGSSNLNCV